MTSQRCLAWLALAVLVGCGGDSKQNNGRDTGVSEELLELQGFYDLSWDPDNGRLFIEIDSFDQPFIYQTSLPRGVGSNDLGLDRGQLGATRVVRFIRSGPKVLLVQDNLQYRANSTDADEHRAVSESFARSVLWGFELSEEDDSAVLIDATDFFLRDADGLAARLALSEEGNYAVDSSRSAIYIPRTKAFQDNTEIEAILTYTGRPAGEILPSVVPDPTAITVHSHHSFIRLPDDDYEPLAFDPRAGVIGLDYGSSGVVNYATPIGDALFFNYGRRHRLQKKNPQAEVSDAVEPIVYYVDRGAPEPVRSALVEGASWWNDAFEVAGYKDAFQVKLLPEGVDPMDVRYNVIQWVHRSTRGWSYGSSVVDPRSGEILKGHVTLGSLRVRQDYMIAEGLLAPYGDASNADTMLQMSLARIRQLSAHEVGHTLGFAHNFAASTQNRASVMDYPVPLIRFDDNGELDLSDAYGVGIGAWDERTVLYSYQDFPDSIDASARAEILQQTIEQGYAYVADSDSRSIASAHPSGNLWDNGEDALIELDHLLKVRAHALKRFSDKNIRQGRPLASIEEVLVPVYLLHRYQLQAVGKLVGGLYYDYSMRGDTQAAPKVVSEAKQMMAIQALLKTLHPDQLRLPDGLAERIPPRPPGHPRNRESFSGATGVTFDPLAPAASATSLTLDVLLNPERAARMNRSRSPRFGRLVSSLITASWRSTPAGADIALQRQTNMLVLEALMRLAVNESADADVQATALGAIDQIYALAGGRSVLDAETLEHFRLARFKIERMLADPTSVTMLPVVTVPPGSPIGTTDAAIRAR